MRIGQLLEHMSVINGGAAIGDFDAAPAFRRVFIVMGWMSPVPGVEAPHWVS
jgi:hypothetical protein